MSKSSRLECSSSRQKNPKDNETTRKEKFISKWYINQIIRDVPSWSSINAAVKEIIFKAKPFKNKKKENSSNKILEAKNTDEWMVTVWSTQGSCLTYKAM